MAQSLIFWSIAANVVDIKGQSMVCKDNQIDVSNCSRNKKPKMDCTISNKFILCKVLCNKNGRKSRRMYLSCVDSHIQVEKSSDNKELEIIKFLT